MNGEHSSTPNGNSRNEKTPLNRQKSAEDGSSPRVAHTLTACTRCRQRKTRCDPGLPRCGPCERTNAVCEYWDPSKRCNIKRDYVVWLQHRANELEKEIDRLENEDVTEDPELMMRSGAAVKLQDVDETKFLGPSSGTQITRLVMQLAKQFTDSKTIKEIVPDARARQAQEMYAVEAAKPTSKVYPLISSVAAEDLPNKDLLQLLYQLYCLKVQPMYPALHEPTLAADIEAAQNGTADPFQNFVTRMVIAISLQKMDTQYAGLADSYYLAALKYMEAVVQRMDLKTLQAFALVAEYSLLTPTRTAIYYIVGIAVRLVQALGIHEEASISRLEGNNVADPLETDMRRRLFWCIFTMEAGLSHALGRPMSLAIGREHFDVNWFYLCDDVYINREMPPPPGAPTILKKWIAMHFFKMRLLQLEIRRKLYLKKRATPKDDQDPWFAEMLQKMDEWRDIAPENDQGIGLDKAWFIGRYNTMIAFLYRPSPQIPRPSLTGAMKCFDAAKYNIYMTREQIRRKNVDLTWIFTQAIFMAINTMLWSLSYEQVRKQNPRGEVQQILATGMENILIAVDRWPGVASAHALYTHIIDATLKIYDKDGDVPISTGTPSDAPSPLAASTDSVSRSRTTSPAFIPPQGTPDQTPPFGYFHHPAKRNDMSQAPSIPQHLGMTSSPITSSPSQIPTSTPSSSSYPYTNTGSPESVKSAPHSNGRPSSQEITPNIPQNQFQPLPNDFNNLAMSGWNQPYSMRPPTSGFPAYDPYAMPPSSYSQQQPGPPPLTSHSSNPTFPPTQSYDFGYPLTTTDTNQSLHQSANEFLDPNFWNNASNDMQGFGLSSSQQMELMQSLETTGMGDIEMMIQGAQRIFPPVHQRMG
ncbi:fungal specific transcription factor domain-containing protein 45 [Elsinoe australis]|uniref:Fungal specific transcription factor domain-containing protein 45 n=1 Tax=Elsinoe australis TaxID=40998 RepID=A0A4U7AUZ4_9PEZI|nr:fungal specific transcription factor domain-containing protein 45 [Elsinoe australis]